MAWLNLTEDIQEELASGEAKRKYEALTYMSTVYVAARLKHNEAQREYRKRQRLKNRGKRSGIRRVIVLTGKM